MARRTYLDRIRASRTPFTVAIVVVLTLYCLIALFLIPNVMLSSFKTRGELINNIMGFPHAFTLENYVTVLVEDNFIRYFMNSVVLSGLALTSLLFFASMTAYGLSRYRFRGRDALQVYFLLGTMFPIQLGILPIFIIIRTLGLTNTFLGMILIYTANMSLAVFIFSKFFRTLPYALYESARIDGAGEFRIFVQIMLPMSKPVLSTVGIIQFVLIWNDFYMPLVFLTRREVRTLTLAIFRYLSNFLANWHLVFTAATIALVPVIVVFFLFSEQLVAGLTAGSMKE
tara:strand:- start:96 stop:950 length:855 start_codon:yes stop_codon:yes gene_type:complete